MPDIDVLLLVNLPELTPYQEVEFLQQMDEQGWTFVEECQGFYAAYPGSIGDREVVAQSERELRRAVEYSGLKGWDAVCLLKDSSGKKSSSMTRFASASRMSKAARFASGLRPRMT